MNCYVTLERSTIVLQKEKSLVKFQDILIPFDSTKIVHKCPAVIQKDESVPINE